MSHRHRPVDPLAAAFQRLEHDQIPAVVESIRCQREGFGNAAPGVVEDVTEGPHGALGLHGGIQERIALGGGEDRGVCHWDRKGNLLRS